MYVNTFAKSLAPGLRIGYLVLPNALMARYRERFSRYSSTVPSFDQYTLAAFMHTGGFERHISRSRKVYQARRDALMTALDRELADLPHEVSRSEAGLHLLLHMRNGMLEHELIERAKASGVRVYPLSAYYTPPGQAAASNTRARLCRSDRTADRRGGKAAQASVDKINATRSAINFCENL